MNDPERVAPPEKARALALLIPYLVLLFYLTVVWRVGAAKNPVRRLNLVPFRMVEHYVHEAVWWTRHPAPRTLWVIGRGLVLNVVGNLAALAPFGFLLPRVRGRPTSAWQVLVAGAALSTLIEALQYLTGGRVADVDDVWLKALGALLGYGCHVGLGRWRRPAPGLSGPPAGP